MNYSLNLVGLETTKTMIYDYDIWSNQGIENPSINIMLRGQKIYVHHRVLKVKNMRTLLKMLE